MISKHSIYRLINIHESESPIVFRLLGIQFALGLATSFLVTASYTLFLYKYPITKAPLVYLLAAMVLFPINALYARLDLKLNSKKLLQVTIMFAASSMAILLLLWTVTKIHWIALLLVAWNLMLYMVVGYGYWGLASLLFNVRESRRIFSVIGSGDLPAKIIGYLCVSLLAPVAGIEFIMAFAVVFFVLAFFLCKKLFGHSAINWEEYETEQHHVAHEPVTNWWMRLFENELIQWIAALSLMGYLIFLLIDYTFLSEIKVRYKSAHELAGFISLFFATGRLVSIFFKVLFTSRLITRLGLTRSLMITPILILLITVAVMMVPMADPHGKTYLYAFGIMTLFSEVLRSTIQEPVFFILFQPLNIHLRLKGHLVAKGYVYPPALLLVGAGLMIWLSFNESVPMGATLWIVAGLLIIWLLIIGKIKVHYFDVVQRSIQKGFFSGISLFLNDDTVIKTLLKKTRTGPVRERIHALSLLEKSAYKDLDPLFSELIDCDDKDLQLFILERIQHYRFTSSKSFIFNLMETCTDEKLKKEAFQTLCLIDKGFLSRQMENWEALSTEFRQATLVSLARMAKDGAEQSQLQMRLEQMAKSNSESDQLLVLEIMNAAPNMADSNTLELLMKRSPGDLVYNKLLETFGKLKLEAFLPELLHALKEKKFKTSAQVALTSMKELLFDHKDKLKSLEGNQQELIADIAGKTKTEAATGYLLGLYRNESVDPAIVTNALWEQQYSTEAGSEQPIHEYSEKLVDSLNLKTKLWQQISKEKHPQLLRAMDSEIHNDCLQLMRLLAMQYGRQKLSRVIELMEMEQYSKMHNAIELLELSLPHQTFQHIDSVLDFLVNSKLEKPTKPQPFLHTAETIFRNANSFNTWTRSLTWYLAGKEPGDNLLPALVSIPDNSESPIIRETKAFVIFNHNHKSN